MCCIFTCVGWMIDLFQRAWVFAMSCCISSAVCCSLVTASMSGVALGYNYSLAEYIELKETNVSVYLKRGVFDDEVVDEMDWRRSGGGPPSAQRRSAEETEAPSSVPDFPHGFRRANDEGMFATTQINKPNDLYGHDPDHHRFEGSLLKLTAKPNIGLDPGVANQQMAKVMTAYPDNSMDQLKALQGLMNRRVMQNDPSATALPSGFSLPQPYMVTLTGSIPLDAFTSASGSTLPGMSEEMKVIQKLLNDHKMQAKQFEALKRTQKPTRAPSLAGVVPEMFPDFHGPERRVGGSDKSGAADAISQILQSNLLGPNDHTKWYQPKPVQTTVKSIFNPTELKGPVTLQYTTTRRKIKPDDVTPLSQDSFRRAMQEAATRESKDKEDNEKEVQNIINEPTKDYDEEDVKGFPVRKKRKKRNKRNIEESPLAKNNIETEDKPNHYSGTGLFSKLMTAFMKLKFVYAPEEMETNEIRSSKDLSRAPSEMSTDIVTSSFVNIKASSTRALLSKVIKSTVVS